MCFKVWNFSAVTAIWEAKTRVRTLKDYLPVSACPSDSVRPSNPSIRLSVYLSIYIHTYIHTHTRQRISDIVIGKWGLNSETWRFIRQLYTPRYRVFLKNVAMSLMKASLSCSHKPAVGLCPGLVRSRTYFQSWISVGLLFFNLRLAISCDITLEFTD